MNVHEYLGLKSPTVGDIGVEVEIEGARLPNLTDNEGVPNNPYWLVTHDGSLRNGLEYVFQGPFPFDRVLPALESLDEAFKANKSVLSPSMRCSTHIHVNMHDKTFCQALVYATAYYILEEALSHNCGRNRAGNLFALRLVDSYGVVPNHIIPAITQNRMSNFGADAIRYAGLNFKALVTKGTLEFRMLGTTTPLTDKTLEWVTLLYNLRQNSLARFQTPVDIVESFSGDGARQFAVDMLGQELADKWVFSVDKWEEMCYRGVRLVQDYTYEVDDWLQVGTKKDKIKSPKITDWVVQNNIGVGGRFRAPPPPNEPMPVEHDYDDIDLDLELEEEIIALDG